MTHLYPFLHLVPHVEPPAAVRPPPALVHAEHQERVRSYERSPLVALGARVAAPNDQRAALDAARFATCSAPCTACSHKPWAQQQLTGATQNTNHAIA